ncbi:MAG: leucine-rich repeat domain-containing protein, partial [Prevotella sp.]|nr:leucine-rich repeat domain-containing protein [Prevotella sp.]
MKIVPTFLIVETIKTQRKGNTLRNKPKKKMKDKLLVLFTLLCITATVSAFEFNVEYPYSENSSEKFTLYFELNEDYIENGGQNQHNVTLRNSYFPYNDLPVNVNIPSEIEYQGITYTVTQIGKEAFISCNNLRSVIIPNYVIKIGERAFWNCKNVEQIIVGNSVSQIDDEAFQYCHSLKSISLPNSLKTIGRHFLCACKGLETLVIPASVTNIGSYFLHGCESLRKVVLLGKYPPVFEKEGEYCHAFEAQDYPNENGGQVNNCIFYVENEETYLRYKEADGWNIVDKDFDGEIYNLVDYDGDFYTENAVAYRNDENKYAWNQPDDVQPYEAHWMTVRYPVTIDAKACFGEQCMLAKFTNAKYMGIDEKGRYSYNLDFTLVDERIIEANVPYLLKADVKNVGSAFVVPHVDNEENISDEEGMVSVHISNQHEDPSAKFLTEIIMLGTFHNDGHYLNPGEFLFSNPGPDYDNNMKFYMQNEKLKPQRHINKYKCYWQIIKDNEPSRNSSISSIKNQTTGIEANTIEYENKNKISFNIYDLKGQRISTFQKGINIINGEKYLIINEK